MENKYMWIELRTSGTSKHIKQKDHLVVGEYIVELYAPILSCSVREYHNKKNSLDSTPNIYKIHVYGLLHKILLKKELIRDQTFYSNLKETN